MRGATRSIRLDCPEVRPQAPDRPTDRHAGHGGSLNGSLAQAAAGKGEE